MVKCVFCGKDQHAHKGLHYISNDGTTKYFCSSRCKRNSLNLKRDNRKIRWTEAFHETREKAKLRAKVVAEKEEERKKAEEESEKQSKEDKKEDKKDSKKKKSAKK